MCDCNKTDPPNIGSQKYYVGEQAMTMAPESHMVYELRQRMQHHINKIVEIQKAIDAINNIN